jgi:hypothetical protein
MISERTFAERYTSFWHQAFPLGKDVVGLVNSLKQTFSKHRPEPGIEVRHDLISEISLRWFAACVVEGRLSKDRPSESELERLTMEACAFVGRLRGSPVPELPPPSPAEMKEAEALAEVLSEFVRTEAPHEIIVPRPPFAGCGLLSACRGDLLIGQTLYEIKAVDEGFTQPDLRQLLTYCALNFAAPRYAIRSAGLLNPRLGTFFRSDLEWLVQSLSGREPAELFYEIIDFLATERISA